MLQNHSRANSSNAKQVFRQFAWNLAGSLKTPKIAKNSPKRSRVKTRSKRGGAK